MLGVPSGALKRTTHPLMITSRPLIGPLMYCRLFAIACIPFPTKGTAASLAKNPFLVTVTFPPLLFHTLEVTVSHLQHPQSHAAPHLHHLPTVVQYVLDTVVVPNMGVKQLTFYNGIGTKIFFRTS